MSERIRTGGRYELMETVHGNRVLVLNETDRFAWVSTREGDLLVWMMDEPVKDHTLSHGQFFLGDFESAQEPGVMPHLLLQEAGRYWAYLLPDGLPTVQDPEKRIAKSDLVLTEEMLTNYLREAPEGDRSSTEAMEARRGYGADRTAGRETVIVTGSSGLIGRSVVERLSHRYHVVGFDVVAPKQPSPAEFIEVDISSDESVAGALDEVRRRHGDCIASVVHLAAYYDFSGEPSPKYEEITVRGTQRLLRALQAFTVEQFIFSSTILVHAPCEPGQRIDEEWPLEPKWAYPESKLQTETLLREEHGEIPIVLLRMAGVYDDRCHSIPIARQIQRIYERAPTSRVFPGDLSHGQSFLHLEDLVDALELTVERRKELPSEVTLLLGEPETLSYDELQRELGRLIHGEEGEDWQTMEVPKPLAKAGTWLQDALPLGDPFIKPWMIDIADDHYALDITRARRLLGWEPQHSLRTTLPAMVAALKADPVRWYRENKLEPPAAPQPAEAAAARGAVSKEDWALLLGGIGVGAALMYLMDPDRGRRRRNYLRDQAVHAARSMGNAAGARARDLRNRASGLAAEVGARLHDGEVPDEKLVARVRSEMGHAVSHAHAHSIEVSAEAGRVTLSGPVPATEMRRLLGTVSRVRGVRAVENRLEVRG